MGAGAPASQGNRLWLSCLDSRVVASSEAVSSDRVAEEYEVDRKGTGMKDGK